MRVSEYDHERGEDDSDGEEDFNGDNLIPGCCLISSSHWRYQAVPKKG